MWQLRDANLFPGDESLDSGAHRFAPFGDDTCLIPRVAELDRTFVPAIEAISGPAPDWYKPEN